MLVLKGKLRLAVVVASPAPCHGIMAARAILPQPPLMGLFLLMASAALTRRLSIGLSGYMATGTRNARMGVRESEVGLCVVKLKCDELDDIRCAPLVLRVTTAALQRCCIRQLAMQALARSNVVADRLMTGRTQLRLRRSIGEVVAL